MTGLPRRWGTSAPITGALAANIRADGGAGHACPGDVADGSGRLLPVHAPVDAGGDGLGAAAAGTAGHLPFLSLLLARCPAHRGGGAGLLRAPGAGGHLLPDDP